MKSIYFIAMVLASGASAMRLDRLNGNEEARAVENAITDRVVAKLDSADAHPTEDGSVDPTHSAARDAFNGDLPKNSDLIKGLKVMSKENPILDLAFKRTQSPMFPYPVPK